MMGKLAVEDCMCPICMSILIEPVTMPCTHTLCKPCFKQNVEEASLSCPLCRTRISVWVRRATKTGSLVNVKLWNDIKSTYGDKVERRLAGDDDDDNSVYLPIIHLSNPGEIRKEYEAEMQRLAKQRELERQKEIEASEALIKKLQEEEQNVRETRQKEMQKMEEEDEKLAKELTDVMEEAGTDAPINFLMAESRSRLTRSSSAVTCSSGNSGRSSSLRPASTIESFISKMREAEKLKEADRISSSSSLQYLQSTPDGDFLEKSEKFLKVDKRTDTDSKSSDSSLPYMCNDREKSDSSTDMSVKSKSRASSWNYGLVDLHTENGGLFSNELSRDLSKDSSCATDGLICLGAESKCASRSVVISPDIEVITDRLQQELLENSSSSTSKKDRTSSKVSRASSIQSEDSITQELNHFKPINVCPVTPPRKLASGKVIEPPLIRTTPRNLNKTSFSSPTNHELSLSDLDACSPIMQRRLSELEEERKSNVRRLSKSTLTIKRYDEGDTNENESVVPADVDNKNNSAKVEQTQKALKRKAMDIDDVVSSNEAGVVRKLMIPLESNIDDSMDFDIPPPLSENNNIINVDSDSRSSSGSALLKKKQKRTGKQKQEDNISQTQIICKKGPSEEKQRCDSFSPQRSITDWVVKADKSCRGSRQSPNFFTQTLQAACLGRDEVDGDLKSKVEARKSQTRTIDHFMTKVDNECKKSKTIQSKRKRKTNQNKDYVWPDYSPKKRDTAPRHPVPSSSDFFASDVVSDEEINSSTDIDTQIPTKTSKRRCISDRETDRADFKRRKVDEIPKRNYTKKLKSLKKSSSSLTKNSKGKVNLQKCKKLEDSVLSSDICNVTDTDVLDLSESGVSLPVDANLNIVCMDSSKEVYDILHTRKKQEEMDKLLALKLSKEFEIEAKLGLTAFRFKGNDNEYKLRRHPRSKSKKLENVYFDT
ncbi:E3 ubiquitin-protein ligase RNF169-like [Ylistrum balloti]|uniref:E3 ubiquitin-protein ligase RNF169-like n=1 Tax=Ylistrum balloti TaxID=509963 RepID=UPI002905F3B6|nr:E3 ubiquitin-protein ligase RNF169-like [Ylistrum balloti]